MIRFYSFILFLFFINISFAQSSTLIGSSSSNEYAYAICADNNGNTYFGATSNNEAWIFKRDINSQVLWSKQLNTINVGYSSDVSYIDIIGDTIFGCGWLKTGTTIEGSLIFKLNATTGLPYWIKSEALSNTYFSSMKYANGRYFVTGSQVNNAAGYNGKVVALSSTSGTILWQTAALGINFPGFGIDYIDDFYSTSEMINGKMFITGRSYVNGSNIDMRTLLIGIDDQGIIFLSKYLQFNTATTATSRFYGISIEYDGSDSLVIVQYGDDNCSTCTDNIAGLIKTDLNGNVAWCKQYNLGGISLEVGRGLNITPTSYVFYGYANLNQPNSKMFAIKTDKNGIFETAKLISLGSGNLGHISGPLNCGGASNFKNGLHYIPGAYFTTNTNSRDIAQIILDQNLDDPQGCLTISPVTVNTIDFPPFSNNINLISIPNTIAYNLNPILVDLEYLTPCNEIVNFNEVSSCDSSIITASIQNIINPTFNWSNGQTGSSITVYDSDTLILTVVNPLNCCMIVDTIVPFIVNSNIEVQLPSDTTFCFDQSSPFIIQANVSNASGNLSFEWNNQEENDSIIVNQSGMYWVNVTNECEMVSDTINVIINQTPLLTSELFDTICNQNTTSINLTSDLNANYSWLASNNQFVSGETTLASGSNNISDLLTNNSSTIQNVIYSVTVSNGSCSSVQDVIISVIPALDAPIITSNGPTSFCDGGFVQLTSNFQFDNIWSTGETAQTISVSSSDTISLYNQVNQCYSAITSIIITESSASLPTASLSGGGIFCAGEIINPVIVSFTGNGPWTIDYEINGVSQIPIVSSNSTLILGQLPANYQITNLYDLNCSNVLNDSASITINPTPILNVTSIAICEGSTGSLTATPNLLGGSFLWSPNGEVTSTINVSPQFTSNYSVVYTLNNCPSSTAVGNVVVNSLPNVSFNADTLSGCIPLTVNFSSTSPSDPNSCEWTFSNGITLIGCNPSYTFDQPGCFDVTLTNSLNGCSSSNTSNNYICVNGYPEAIFTGNPLVINLDNSTVTFDNLSVGANSYEWDFGDGTNSDSINPSHNFAINEQGYVISLTAYSEYGCSSTDSLVIIYEEDLIFYVPNAFTPDGDNFNQVFKPIFTSGFDPTTYNLAIFDRWGEILFESNDVNIGWDGSYIQTPNLVQDGIYVWRISFKLKKNDERKVFTGHVNVLK